MRLHFSGLNGLRAIAALAVVFSHTTATLGDFGLNSHIFGQNADGYPKTMALAGFGVSIFFTLSGFLITFLLLKEKEQGSIGIKNFYIRRILRIWPLYYSYLALAVVTAWLFHEPFDKPSLLFYIFLAANVPFIFGGALPSAAHFWSLGVEEQFYAFWPWIVKRSKYLLTTATVLCCTLIVMKLAARLIDIRSNGDEIGTFYNFLQVTRFHCMLIGAIAAILYYQNTGWLMKWMNNLVTQLICWAIIFLCAINKFHIVSVLDNEVISLVSVGLIIGQIEKSKRFVSLENTFFDFIGKISYGIYVLHPLIIFYLSKLIIFQVTPNVYHYLIVYGTVFIATISISTLSYFLFEKWFLDRKEKYTKVRTIS